MKEYSEKFDRPTMAEIRELLRESGLTAEQFSEMINTNVETFRAWLYKPSAVFPSRMPSGVWLLAKLMVANGEHRKYTKYKR